MSARPHHRTTSDRPRPNLRLAVGVVALVAVVPLGAVPGAIAEPVPAGAADRASLTVDSAAHNAAATTTAAVPAAATGAVSTVPTTATTAAAADRAAAAARTSRAASAQQALAARQARFTHFTLNSADTKDMRGVEPSMYRGKYFNAKAEEKRLCIVKRESEGEYDVINPTGSYFGAYQVSRPLARGVTFMMLPEHKKLMGTAKAKEVLAKLRSKPMNTWPRYWQDAAFHTIINWEGTLSGASHWAGGRWTC